MSEAGELELRLCELERRLVGTCTCDCYTCSKAMDCDRCPCCTRTRDWIRSSFREVGAEGGWRQIQDDWTELIQIAKTQLALQDCLHRLAQNIASAFAARESLRRFHHATGAAFNRYRRRDR